MQQLLLTTSGLPCPVNRHLGCEALKLGHCYTLMLPYVFWLLLLGALLLLSAAAGGLTTVVPYAGDLAAVTPAFVGPVAVLGYILLLETPLLSLLLLLGALLLLLSLLLTLSSLFTVTALWPVPVPSSYYTFSYLLKCTCRS